MKLQKLTLASSIIGLIALGATGYYLYTQKPKEIKEITKYEKSESTKIGIIEKKQVNKVNKSLYPTTQESRSIIRLNQVFETINSIHGILNKHSLTKQEKRLHVERLHAQKFAFESEISNLLNSDVDLGSIEEKISNTGNLIQETYDEFLATGEISKRFLSQDSLNKLPKRKTIETSFLGTNEAIFDSNIQTPPSVKTSYILRDIGNSLINSAYAAELLSCQEFDFPEPKNPEAVDSIFLNLDKTEVAPSNEMRQLAQKLSTPVNIYRYVKDEVEYEPYLGAMQNAESVFLRKKANPYDQSSLLISLLRSAGIPARYVKGDILMSVEQLKRLWQLNGDNDVFNMHFAIASRFERERGEQRWLRVGDIVYYRVPHMWVEAFIPYDSRRGLGAQTASKSWIPLDPSFDNHEVRNHFFTSQQVFSDVAGTGKPLFSVSEYLKEPSPRDGEIVKQELPSEVLIENIVTQLNFGLTNGLSWAVDFRFYITPGDPIASSNEALPIGPMGAEACIFGKTANLNNDDINQFVVEYAPGFSETFRAPDIALKDISIRYSGETSLDEDKLNQLANGTLNPSDEVNVKAAIFLDDEMISESSLVQKFGDDTDIKMTSMAIPIARSSFERLEGTTIGSTFSIHSTFRHYSRSHFDNRLQRMLGKIRSVNLENASFQVKSEIAAAVNSLALLQHYGNYETSNTELAAAANGFYVDGVHVMSVQSGVRPQFLDDRLLGFAPEAPLLSWIRAGIFVSKSGGRFAIRPGYDDLLNVQAYDESSSVHGSALEHRLFEEFFSLPSQSTVRVIQHASEQNVPIVDVEINESNFESTIRNNLSYSTAREDRLIETLQDRLPGRLIIPQSNVSIDGQEFFVAHYNGDGILGSGFNLIGRANGGVGLPGNQESSTGISLFNIGEAIVTFFSGLIDTVVDVFSIDLWNDLFNDLSSPGGEILADIYEEGNPVEVSCSKSVGQPVNLNNGGMWHNFVDFPPISGPGEQLQFNRTYAAKSTTERELGYGWTHNYDLFLTNIDGSQINFSQDSSFNFHDGTGNTVPIIFENGEWVLNPSRRLVFEKLASEYVITNSDQKKYYFFGTGDFLGKISRIEDRNGNEMTFSYEISSRRLVSITDSVGRTISLDYNPDGNLSKVSDFTGREVLFSYDGNNDLIQSIDLNGNAWTYTYLSGMANTVLNHNMSSWKDPRGFGVDYFYYENDKTFKHIEAEKKTTTFIYNTFDRETTVVNARNESITYQYDIAGNVTKITNPDQTFRLFTYNVFGIRTSEQDEDGFVTRFNVDERGNIVQNIPPQPFGTTTFSYDPVYNTPNKTVDGNLNETDIEIDPANGNILSQTRYFDLAKTRINKTEFTYDSDGRLSSTTDGNNNTTLVSRLRDSDFSEVVTTTDAAGNTLLEKFDPLGRLIESTNRDGVVSRFTYDNKNNRITEERVGSGVIIEMKYDVSDNVTNVVRKASGAQDLESTFEYDGLKNVVSTTNERGEKAEFDFSLSSCGCSIEDQVKMIKDPKGNITKFSYDFRGNLLEEIDPKGNVTKFTRDSRGNLTSVTNLDAAGKQLQKTFFDYGPLNTLRIKSKNAPVGSSSLRNNINDFNLPILFERYTYDPVGNIIKISNTQNNNSFGSEERLFEYDGLNQVIKKTLNSPNFADEYTYSYDDNLNLISATNSSSELLFSYNSLNRRTSTETVNDISRGLTQPNVKLNYDYSPSGLVREIKDSLNSKIVGFSFDSVNRLNEVNGYNQSVQFSRDSFERIQRMDFSNGISTNISFSDQNRVVERKINGVDFWNYSYDRNGNVSEIASSRGNWDYSYDQLNQLITSSYSGSSNIQNEDFIYDGMGNRVNGALRRSRFANPNDVRPQIINNVLLIDGEGFGPFANPRAGKFSYRYDIKGRNIERFNNETNEHIFYEYNADDELRRIRITRNGISQNTLSFKYDALGRRIEKEENKQGVINRRYYVYDRNNILEEYDINGTKRATYIGTGEVDSQLFMILDDKAYFYHKDHLGSNIGMTDLTGKIKQKVIYSSFGEILNIFDGNGASLSFDSSNEPIDQPFYYTGREWDNESNLHYYRARYYNPENGRFMSEDPIGFTGLDYNLFRYVANNPVNFVDPSGLIQFSPDESSNIVNTVAITGEFKSTSFNDFIGIAERQEFDRRIGAAVFLSPLVSVGAFATAASAPAIVNACLSNPAACSSLGANALDFADQISGELGGPTTGLPPMTPLGEAAVGGIGVNRLINNLNNGNNNSCGE